MRRARLIGCVIENEGICVGAGSSAACAAVPARLPAIAEGRADTAAQAAEGPPLVYHSKQICL